MSEKSYTEFVLSKMNGVSSLRWAVVLICLSVLGCGKTHPPVAKVHGTITFQGKPAVGGRVLFLPDGGGKQGLGTIQPDGKFELGTFSSDDGAMVGNHHAMIVRVAFDVNDKKLSTFRSAGEESINVEADKVNELSIDLGSSEWQKLAD